MEADVISRVLIAGIGIATAIYFFRIGYEEERKDAVYGGAGWMMLSLYYILRHVGISREISEMLLYFYALGMALYTVTLLEDVSPTALRYVKCYLLVPMSHVLYRAITLSAGLKRAPIGGIAGDSGFMLLISAYILWKGLGEDGRLTSIGMIILGIDLTLYKFIGDTFVDVLFILAGALLLSFASIRKYSRLVKVISKGEMPEIKPGIKIVPDAYFEVLLETLEDKPVLFFTRDLNRKSENWTIFYVTNTQVENGVRPTELEKMTHLAVRFLREVREAGGRGIVAIDCLEFLRLYNDLKSILKFLHTLRDYALKEGGSVIVAYTPEAWEENEKAMLLGIQ
ncbi:hypothetical protein A3L04_08900 [Thermococcus chitonophagus]|uniref:DUF835 domain-containing protein n=1 Tax=Thermococcus chitonophagus TaxID=54262 RepID=A0A160VTF3_9EURY|nr:DUF835 domain-containing protein [Thermococcus chitonophagus]ASJ17177.1 hypothetical protein A3L04_08900 [Thermococcus chitonophagus]CUX77786.1 hypothetical protein CHITON_1007 [Thermococcus chitonophagus]